MTTEIANHIFYPQILSILRSNYNTDAEYLAAFADCNMHYDFKARVYDGWKFFEFIIDYRIWKNQK